mmetsp:Transcript_2492/g.2883  ORF Transcript_2492/g.2883 Transcript_2492/m.2883 type:complete len:156 (-) Transcript_2492:454-921(-)
MTTTDSALVRLFGQEILTKEGLKATDEVLAGKKHIMIYFSAHWCPPCRAYTPQLSDAYSASELAGTDTVIIFVSSDQDENGFNSYYGSMSFYALPYSDRERKEALSTMYGVQGIPTLVLLNGDGELVNGNIRGQHGKYLGTASSSTAGFKGCALC